MFEIDCFSKDKDTQNMRCFNVFIISLYALLRPLSLIIWLQFDQSEYNVSTSLLGLVVFVHSDVFSSILACLAPCRSHQLNTFHNIQDKLSVSSEV